MRDSGGDKRLGLLGGLVAITLPNRGTNPKAIKTGMPYDSTCVQTAAASNNMINSNSSLLFFMGRFLLFGGFRPYFSDEAARCIVTLKRIADLKHRGHAVEPVGSVGIPQLENYGKTCSENYG